MSSSKPQSLARRDFVRLTSGLAVGAFVSSSLWSRAAAASVVTGPGPYGSLQPADANGILLPAGFSSRIIARSGQGVATTGYTWHTYPDGGAVFAQPDGGYIYVSNSEVSSSGGASAIRFGGAGNVQSAYRICTGTRSNCAGGKTPWNTWLTCEEYSSGSVWECDPTGASLQIKRAALGKFKHEAAAVDPETGFVYMTEDETDGRLYRFRPTRAGDLSAGVLEAAGVATNGAVTWYRVPRPNPSSTLFDPTRRQVSASKAFNGGEGIVYSQGIIYFTTKGDNRVWELDPFGSVLSVLYDANQDPGRQLTGVDNVAASSGGDLVVAEDGGNMELVLISAEGTASPLLRVSGQSGSELCGPAFDPSGSRLYFSSQRGGSNGRGITYEITGPFRG